MTAQLRAELLKQRSTQTALFLLLAMVGLVALAVALHVLALSPARLATNTHQLEVFQVGTRAGMLFAALAGALAITSESASARSARPSSLNPGAAPSSPPSSPSAHSPASPTGCSPKA